MWVFGFSEATSVVKRKWKLKGDWDETEVESQKSGSPFQRSGNWDFTRLYWKPPKYKVKESWPELKPAPKCELAPRV